VAQLAEAGEDAMGDVDETTDGRRGWGRLSGDELMAATLARINNLVSQLQEDSGHDIADDCVKAMCAARSERGADDPRQVVIWFTHHLRRIRTEYPDTAPAVALRAAITMTVSGFCAFVGSDTYFAGRRAGLDVGERLAEALTAEQRAKLSTTQKLVLALLAKGKSYKEIGAEMGGRTAEAAQYHVEQAAKRLSTPERKWTARELARLVRNSKKP